LIAYLAHLGSLVPAEAASIPVLDAMRSRIRTTDSVAVGLSAFAADLGQMASVVATASDKTLILVDEFGKGTAEVDGQSLLAATCQHLLELQSKPFAIVATHFASVRALMRGRADVSLATFEHTTDAKGQLVFLYRLIADEANVSGTSQALNVARTEGLEDHIIRRSAEILSKLVGGGDVVTRSDVYPFSQMETAVEDFFEANLEDCDLRPLLDKFKESFHVQ